ncbi:uncharacterized protein LOC111619448 [Centruroides sculpturatus]|uniref:uncharacterized protein LOC111619448 n=1 Tax=Centruroides sculpturatus TaxID=218467 RepID=UPI000C6EAD26|nr:uncharacterized protein LOC111619448 [Centruroides sculpturatus]
MPFSIKRFTIRRSTSLPGGTKAVNGRKLTLTEIREQVTLPVERKEKKYEQVEDRKIMQNQTPNMTSSRSLDVSELRRLGYIELPPAPGNPDSGQEVVLRRNRLPHGMHGSAVVAVRDRQNATLPGRWRSSGGHQVTSTLTDARGVVYGDQVVGAEFRRVVVRRNGVRFQGKYFIIHIMIETICKRKITIMTIHSLPTKIYVTLKEIELYKLLAFTLLIG